MAAQAATDLLRTYVRLLRGFGLSVDEVASRHGLDELTPRGLRAALRERRGASELTPADYHRSLHRTLAHSSRGIGSRTRYWNHAPATQLGDAFSAYGCEFSVRDPRTGEATSCATHHEPVELHLRERATGRSRSTRFAYPDTPLEDNNYPALVHAVDERLLADTTLRFVLLADRIGHWRFVLVEDDALARLRERHGDRVEAFGRPLLRADQPAAYAEDVAARSVDDLARLPPELVPEEPDAYLGASGPLDRERVHSFDDVAATVDDAASAADVAHGDGTGPTVDALVDADDPRSVVTDGAGVASTDSPTGEATDERVQALFADLGDVSLSREEVDRFRTDTTTGASAADESGADANETADDDISVGEYDPTPTYDSVEGDMDEVFEHLEREAATTTVGKRGDADADRVTSGDVIEALDHENAAADADVEQGFIWVDPTELTARPDAVYDAMVAGS
jgi:hypothetical protein